MAVGSEGELFAAIVGYDVVAVVVEGTGLEDEPELEGVEAAALSFALEVERDGVEFS